MMRKRSRALRRAAVACGAVAAIAVPASAFAVPPWTETGTTTVACAGDPVIPPGGAYMFLASTCTPTRGIVVIDAATMAVVDTIPLPTGAYYMDLSHDGRSIYAWKEDQSPTPIYKVDVATRQLVHTYTVPDIKYAAVAADDAGIYYGRNNGPPQGVDYLNLTTGLSSTFVADTVLNAASGSGWARGLIASPDGTTLYVGSDRRNKIMKVDVASKTVAATWAMSPASGSVNAFRVSADGTRLYALDDDNGSFAALDTQTGTSLVSLDTGSHWSNQAPHAFDVNPTGTFAVVTGNTGSWNATDNFVKFINLTTGAVASTILPLANTEQPWGVAINPAGTAGFVSAAFDAAWGNDGTLFRYSMLAPPDAPISPSAVAGNGTLTVSYSTPADNGSPITDYEYSLDGGTTWKSAATTGTSFTISGLTNGTQYSVKVRAVNAIGAGQASDAVTGTPTAPASNSQAAAETTPAITIPAATVASGATLTSTVSPSVAGTVKVTATLAGRTVCTATKKATRAGRMTVTCNLTKGAKAVISTKAVTLKVTARLTDAAGKTATASRNVKVARYVVKVPVTG